VDLKAKPISEKDPESDTLTRVEKYLECLKQQVVFISQRYSIQNLVAMSDLIVEKSFNL
jgi:hypothetical protein